MALIVEDGTGVADANTYIDRDAAIAYAAARGVVLPNTDVTDQRIIKAMDYLTLYDYKWKGYKTVSTNALPWPRKSVYIEGELFPDNEIPSQLVRAQADLVLQVTAGINLLPTFSADTAFVTREKVDVIETEYSEAIALQALGTLPDMPLIDALLAPLLASVGRLRTVRI
jgi:hypothetical protein